MTATCGSVAVQRERIVAFPRQEWLRERAIVLCNAYIAVLVLSKNVPDLAKENTEYILACLNCGPLELESSAVTLDFRFFEGYVMLWTRRYESGGIFF
jgi:hypothetical protein